MNKILKSKESVDNSVNTINSLHKKNDIDFIISIVKDSQGQPVLIHSTVNLVEAIGYLEGVKSELIRSMIG